MEMALAGGVGFEVDISKVPVERELFPVEVLFSESQARFIVSFDKGNLEKLRGMFDEFAVIGEVKEKTLLFKNKEKELARISLEKAQEFYNSLPKLLGE